ncbi:MAG: creatininase family protein [Acidobacteriota bacterium]
MLIRVLPVLALAAAAVSPLFAQQPQLSEEERARRMAEYMEQVKKDLATPTPIQALDSVWIEELTWMEVRDAMAAGKTTAIVSTGGIEQNGPYVATGKHNYILESSCEMIARQLGDALCAPIIKLVPEGSIDPPSGHMLYPGTISVRQETFEAMLEDVVSSLKAHGFETVALIGDSGGNQRGMKNVAERLNERWGQKIALFVPEYYANDEVMRFMNEDLGIVEPKNDGLHDFYWATAMQMVTDPATVRYDERVAAGKAMINGVSIAPKEDSIKVGRQLLQVRVEATVAAIQSAIR